jgi:superfamily II DNA or RNA helicase
VTRAEPAERFLTLTCGLSATERQLLAAIAAEERLGPTAAETVVAVLDTGEGGARAFLERGLESGLLERSGRVRALRIDAGRVDEPAFAVRASWRQLALRDSQRRGELAAVGGACAVVLGERSRAAEELALQSGRVGRDARALRESICAPFDAKWFEGTWSEASVAIAERVLGEALPSLAPCTELYEWARGRARPELLCQHALLRGDLPAQEALTASLPAAPRLAFQAAARFAAGDLAAARLLLDQALAFSARVPACGAAAPLLALMLAGRGGGELARRLLSARIVGREWQDAERALRTLLRYGDEPEAARVRLDAHQQRGASAWAELLLALTVYLHVEHEWTRAAWSKVLAEQAGVWQTNGYAWLARQAAALAQGLGGTDSQTDELLVRDLITPRPDWDKGLSRLARVAEAISDDDERACRVLWFIDTTDGSVNRPALQELRPGQGWSRGRRVSLREAHDAIADLPVEDARVLRCCSETADGRREWSPEAWEALIGHPRVVSAGLNETVEVVRSECRVTTSEERDSLRIEFEPAGARVGVNVVVQSDRRVAVYRVTKAVQRVIDALPRALRIPKHEEARAVAILGKLSHAVAVESPLLGRDQYLTASARPHLRIAPRAGAWLIEAGVRPFGARGRFFVVGTGRDAISIYADGQNLRSTRDLALERAELSLLISECPTLLQETLDSEQGRTVGESLQSWVLGFEGLLGLLAELADATTPFELEWPEKGALRVRGRVTGASIQGSLRREKGWYLVTGGVRLDHVTELSLQELVRLPSVANGRFVQLPSGDFLELEARVRRMQSALASAEVSAAGLKLGESSLATLRLLAEKDSGFATDRGTRAWLARVEQVSTQTFAEPAGLRATLRPYQQEGFRWLRRLTELGLGACLADDMGLGKTVQILALLASGSGPALVVAPTSVCANWRTELERFTPGLKAHDYDGTATLASAVEAKAVVICSYGQLQQDADALSAIDWQTVVLDEAQFIKNPTTRRAQAAHRLRASRRIAATGTPVENHVGDLWSIFRFLNPGLLGSWKDFDLRFVKPAERGIDADVQEALRAELRPYILRRTKAQVLGELPPLTSVRHEIRLSHDEELRYALLRKQINDKLHTAHGKRQYKLQILAEITRLRRFCCHPRLVFPDADLESAKVERFLALAEELRENGHRALVFSQFVDYLSLVREALEERGITYEYLDGSTPKKQRQERVAAFQNGGAPLFLISLKAGGFGLNLTAADYVIHLDPWWNPAVEAQASDRAHRIGQERPVTVYRLIAKNTIEERIVELHERKQRIARQLLEGGEAAAKLSTDELLALLTTPPGESARISEKEPGAAAG